MEATTIETGEINKIKYKIVQLDDKYTIYVSDKIAGGIGIEDENSLKYAAIASFNDLEATRKHLVSLK